MILMLWTKTWGLEARSACTGSGSWCMAACDHPAHAVPDGLGSAGSIHLLASADLSLSGVMRHGGGRGGDRLPRAGKRVLVRRERGIAPPGAALLICTRWWQWGACASSHRVPRPRGQDLLTPTVHHLLFTPIFPASSPGQKTQPLPYLGKKEKEVKLPAKIQTSSLLRANSSLLQTQSFRWWMRLPKKSEC